MIEPTLMIAATCLVGLCIVAFALLRAWQGWLELKRSELERLERTGASNRQRGEIEGSVGIGSARIELADLKERIRKLEAIANGVEL